MPPLLTQEGRSASAEVVTGTLPDELSEHKSDAVVESPLREAIAAPIKSLR